MVDSARERLFEVAARWQVRLGRVISTESSLLGFGLAGGVHVVLKIARSSHDEWNAGRILEAFAGRGTARVLEHLPGAVLLEESRPGTPLVDLVRVAGDEAATGVVIGVIAAMKETAPDTAGYPTAQDWGGTYFRYPATRRSVLPEALVVEARQLFQRLTQTQGPVRLLHGDLQHSNILFDDRHGWKAVDPKGVVAELEFELGAAMRNPDGMPELYTSAVIERRAQQAAAALDLDVDRVVKWTFAQAVLSALWSIEDGEALGPESPALLVASAARQMLT